MVYKTHWVKPELTHRLKTHWPHWMIPSRFLQVHGKLVWSLIEEYFTSSCV